ncbi:MAG: hypothetical protein ACREQ5_00035 [Candidatus Dormibacteria bacterium]
MLGNHAALDRGERVDGKQVTTIHVPDIDPHHERMRTITHEDGIWAQLAAEPAVWVASDEPELADALAAHFRCPVIGMDEASEHFNTATRIAAEGGGDAIPVGDPGEAGGVTAEVTAHVEVGDARAADISGVLE